MGSQATIFVICLIFQCVLSQEPCRTQADCKETGKRCVLGGNNGIIVACEQIPFEIAKERCLCYIGCLKCDGGPDQGISLFIPPQPFRPLPVGCGINYCICTDPIVNQYMCSSKPCTDRAWLEHCETTSPLTSLTRLYGKK